MAIHVEVLAEINQRQVNKEGEKLARSFDNFGGIAGEKFGNQLAGELARVSPKVQKALHGVQNAADSTKKSINGMEDASDRASKAMSTLQRAGNLAADAIEALEAALADDNTTAAEHEKRSLAAAKALEAEEAAARALERAMRGLENASLGIERAKRNEADAVRAAGLVLKAAVADQKNFSSEMNKTRIAGKNLYVGITEMSNAFRNSQHTMVNGKNAFTDSRTRIQRLAESAQDAVDHLRTLGTTAFQTARGLGTVAIPAVVGFLYETAQVAVTASQSLLLLPAAAAAGGAAFLTLQLATQGFGQALKDIRDPKKFAEDLAKLSPAAQQAALSIKGILPVIDSLQRSTQDAFFQGFGEKFQQLSKTFAPGVQNMTTGVAGSFNQGITGVFDTLMTPSNQGNVSSIMDNIAESFQKAAPAAKFFTDALLQLTNVGSSFLPKIGEAITNVASDFATWVSDAAASGDLEKWIQEGIDAVVTLGGAVKDVGVFIYDVFGGASKEDMESWRQSLRDVLTVIEYTIKGLALTADILDTKLPGVNKSIFDMANGLKLVADIVNGIRWFLDPNYNPTSGPLSTASAQAEAQAREAVNKKRLADGLQPLGPNDPLDTIKLQGPGMGPLGGKQYATGGVATGARAIAGTGAGGWSGREGGTDSKLSDTDRRERIAKGLDPSSYAVDPNNPMGPMPGGGYGSHQQDILKAEHDVMSETRDLEDARKARMVLERDNLATGREIEDARWKELEAGWNLQEAQAKLIEKQTGNTKDLKEGMDKLGAALDPDLGLSKGLAGFVENLTKFVGNILFMPTAMKLQQTVNADPIKGGYGLLGIRGAQNMAAGNSPLLGNPVAGGTGYENAYAPTLGGLPGTNAAIGGAPLSPISGLPIAGYPGDAALLSHLPKGGKYDNNVKDLSKGLIDCASGVEDLVNIMDGKSTVGGSLWTGNASSVLPGMGFVPGEGGPGDFRIGYRNGGPGNGHMQATLPGGTPVNFGSTTAIQNGGAGSLGADDPSFTDHYYRPMAGGPAGQTTGGPTTPVNIYAPENTNPALNNPPAPGRGSGMFGPAQLAPPAGVPQGIPFIPGGGMGAPGMPGTGPLLGGPGMIGGGAQQPGGLPAMSSPGLIGGAQQGPTPIGGIGGNEHRGAGGGGIGIQPGGLADQALGIASMGLDVLAPGAGQAAQIGIKEGSRAIQYAGQLAGIATQGVMDTFLPTGGSELASNSWFTRILGGLSGATPAIPNSAGGAKGQAGQGGDQPPLTPEQSLAQHMGNGQGSPGPGNNITINTNQEPDGVKLGNTVSYLNQASHAGGPSK